MQSVSVEIRRIRFSFQFLLVRAGFKLFLTPHLPIKVWRPFILISWLKSKHQIYYRGRSQSKLTKRNPLEQSKIKSSDVLQHFLCWKDNSFQHNFSLEKESLFRHSRVFHSGRRYPCSNSCKKVILKIPKQNEVMKMDSNRKAALMPTYQWTRHG